MIQVEQGRPRVKCVKRWGMIVVFSLQSLHAQEAWGLVQADIQGWEGDVAPGNPNWHQEWQTEENQSREL